ncbi:MAG: zinc ribbon domain-containing protein [Candidatus Omnitrophica bacterium]|nr:zinc ribbon domain-containing protein [Candidatus Omnitrophota bacterium]
MPTYDYECVNGHRFERFQSMTEEPLRTCPECNGAAVRLIGAGAGFIFKGSGFYQTDYKTPPSKAPKEPKETPCGGGSCPAGENFCKESA